MTKPYDLEERTFQFAKEVRVFIKTLEKTITNNEDAKQVIQAPGPIGSNYIEANESLSKKDFIMRIKICRKEAKESRFWLKLLDIDSNDRINENRLALIQEATELMKIFASILSKSEGKQVGK